MSVFIVSLLLYPPRSSPNKCHHTCSSSTQLKKYSLIQTWYISEISRLQTDTEVYGVTHNCGEILYQETSTTPISLIQILLEIDVDYGSLQKAYERGLLGKGPQN